MTSVPQPSEQATKRKRRVRRENDDGDGSGDAVVDAAESKMHSLACKVTGSNVTVPCAVWRKGRRMHRASINGWMEEEMKENVSESDVVQRGCERGRDAADKVLVTGATRSRG
jgi:hypothetical protein